MAASHGSSSHKHVIVTGADSSRLGQAVMSGEVSSDGRTHGDPKAARDREHPVPPPTHAVETLSDAECWRLLVHTVMGRLAVDSVDGAPDLFPVNYVASEDGKLYLRSAPGSKLMAIAANPLVAFEIDGYTDVAAWSVVVRGHAERLDADDEIEESGVLRLISWSPTAKHDFVRITPKTTSGRSFRLSESIGTVASESAPKVDVHTSRSRQPHEIPRFSRTEKSAEAGDQHPSG